MDIAKKSLIPDIYEEENQRIRSAFSSSVRSYFEALVVESFYGTESLTKERNKVPLVRFCPAEVTVGRLWMAMGAIALFLGIVLTGATLGIYVNSDATPPWMIVASTLSVVIFFQFRFDRKELKKSVADKLFAERASIVKMAKLLCTHQIDIEARGFHLESLQDAAVQLSVGARPKDKDMIRLAYLLAFLYRSEHLPELTKKRFEEYYCGEDQDED